MNFKELTLASFAAALALSTGCVVDDDPAGDTEGTDSDPTTMTTGPTGPTGPTTMTTGPTTTTNPTGETDTDPTGETDTDPTGDTDTDTDDIDPDLYDFREDEAGDYAQVDRQGFPAVNTALISADNKDAYNLSAPTDDVAGTFAGDVIATLDFLHLGTGTPGNGLDDELAAAAPALGDPEICVPPIGTNDNCVSQGGPLIFPDVVRIDVGAASAFPNGRDLETPVIDVILAVLLLDVLDNAGDFNGAISAFVDLDAVADGNQGLAQSGNDVEFPGTFPYLAPAHE